MIKQPKHALCMCMHMSACLDASHLKQRTTENKRTAEDSWGDVTGLD